MPIQRYFRLEPAEETERCLSAYGEHGAKYSCVREICYHVETTEPILPGSEEEKTLFWLLKDSLHPSALSISRNTQLHLRFSGGLLDSRATIIEIGPRFNFSTPFSTNAVNICKTVGLKKVTRLEKSVRHWVQIQPGHVFNKKEYIGMVSDRMTEFEYTKANMPVNWFNESLARPAENWWVVPLKMEGRGAIERVNEQLGLAFSPWDVDFYYDMFVNTLKRDPTTVELFDLAQSNSEHSRHWFFRGQMVIAGEVQRKSLIEMIMDTQKYSNPNNTIKFSDNSSAIKGFITRLIVPDFELSDKTNIKIGPLPMKLKEVEVDLIFTAETHNMPTAVSPFSGATTGTGGRLRDVQAVGRGGIPIAGTVGYCVGQVDLPLPGYHFLTLNYPPSFAKPTQVLIEASNGASDYGNKFGEPLILGFTYSYCLNNNALERDEYIKPIMFSGGLGIMDASMRQKNDPEKGMLLVKIGGPVYRIGVGGGAASSVEIQGSNDADLDFNAVQRGDAEMENKLNGVVRTCVLLGKDNPIQAIHDQGAGGNGNVLKELVEPGMSGAVIFTNEFELGDPSISTLELWGAEYQENNAVLIKPEDRHLLEVICARERCPVNFVGVVSGTGRVSLVEDSMEALNADVLENPSLLAKNAGVLPFDMHLEHVLGKMPRRVYQLERKAKMLKSILAPEHPTGIKTLLNMVLSQISVGSKRFLTNKVDRCVTGLVVQQQCVGPTQTPLSDYAVVATSYYEHTGIATSIGTQPLKGLLDPASMARMSVAEALSNLVFVKITELADVKCSGNWMWAAKLPGEGAKMYDACSAMCEMMKDLEIAIDGGKDSLSMAAKVGNETLKSPGTLVISTYAPVPDFRLRVTPDLKGPNMKSQTALIWINIEDQFRLGGSILAKVLSQQGNECPTVLKTGILKRAFTLTQTLLEEKKLLAGHDISDGGLLTCVMEMAIAGMSGLTLQFADIFDKIKRSHINTSNSCPVFQMLAMLFGEECGWVIEVHDKDVTEVLDHFSSASVPCYVIGHTNGFGMEAKIRIDGVDDKTIETTVREVTKMWEEPSYYLELMQTQKDCAKAEFDAILQRKGQRYRLPVQKLTREYLPIKIYAAVIREEGINSDREMISCLMKAEFEVHDVTMTDLIDGRATLDRYRAVVFPGGFSYADTLGSARGWAGNIKFNEKLQQQFKAFKERQDTYSLGICNGCQLMSLMGWVDESDGKDADVHDVALLHNDSLRFECRWVTVEVPEDTRAAILQPLKGSAIGCWVAHGEGRFEFRNKEILNDFKINNCIALKYVDDDLQATEQYPFNPNGSPLGIAGLCSKNGRHLALMPHPERSANWYQWPYVTPDMKIADSFTSPWQVMFNELYDLCYPSND